MNDFLRILGEMGPFESFPHVAVAVSGGSDSLALTLLLNQWIQSCNGSLTGLIVDHRLRPESTQEGEKTQEWLSFHHIPSEILVWEGPKPQQDLQRKARSARYELLSQWCYNHQILHLFLGHHREDQEETILQRVLHGSGPLGLQGMQPIAFHSFGRLLRPLLTIHRQSLIQFLHDLSQPFLTDPSNTDPRFERVRIRSFLESFSQNKKDLSKKLAIHQTHKKQTLWASEIQEEGEKILKQACILWPQGALTLEKDLLSRQRRSVRQWIWSRCLQALGGSPYPFSSIDAMEARLSSQRSQTTLGRVLIAQTPQHWILMRELRNLPSPLPVVPLISELESGMRWDGRWTLCFSLCEPSQAKGWIVPLYDLSRGFSSLASFCCQWPSPPWRQDCQLLPEWKKGNSPLSPCLLWSALQSCPIWVSADVFESSVGSSDGPPPFQWILPSQGFIQLSCSLTSY